MCGFFLSKDAAIHNATAVLNYKQCSVIVDSVEHFIGTVTDRDIRKALLKQTSLIPPSFSVIINKNYTTLTFHLEESIVKLVIYKH